MPPTITARPGLRSGSVWIFTQRESDCGSTTWHYNGERVTVARYPYARRSDAVPEGALSCVFPDGIERWVYPDELSPVPSSNPALRSLPSRLLARPRDRDSVTLAMVALCDVLWVAASPYFLPQILAIIGYRPDQPLWDTTLEDLAADWMDDACGPAQATLDGDVTADDLVRAVRALHLWLTTTA